ncbi:MAG: hypothetical protein N0A16_06015 [Blastocatellia bacterium]|nr:hypothetical protein [Blastocatellia bacterium]MCS7157265.1 hypothetical protein [Blastocatellia bacterium]MDW8167152.1 hypothetical protein [Acidobacteriota bacterium]
MGICEKAAANTSGAGTNRQKAIFGLKRNDGDLIVAVAWVFAVACAFAHSEDKSISAVCESFAFARPS